MADGDDVRALVDRDAVVEVALDYVEGWFDGDPARMARALHPELVKRSIQADGSLGTLTRESMVAFTGDGEGQREDSSDRQIEIVVEHLDGTTAVATVRCHLYVDHLQLVRSDGSWQIVNVLWRRRATG
ncbi:MAG: nuclear transport factor 2 family protein [Jiangellaceae bacterium]